MKMLADAIDAVVAGDLRGLPTLRAASHSELLEAAEGLPKLVVTRLTLIRILKSWLGGQYSADQVSQWASFVRRGYFPNMERAGLRPIGIDYYTPDEDLIVEIMARFDEIDDLIDGVINEDEKNEMLKSLTD
ncbi:hypothetical protein CQ054_10575 [Ochrobactrum sp. MYb29]|nr:hypothetical protein CQ054_10575 [Ochrobactrum sp. MYb29]